MEDLLVASRLKGVKDLFDFHSHDYNEMVLLHGGNCRFLVGNQFYHLQPGDLLMLDGNKIHKAYVYGDPDAYERSLLHFRNDWIRPLLKELELEYLLELINKDENGSMIHFSNKGESFVEGKIREMTYIWKDIDNDISPIEDAQLKMLVCQLLIYLHQSNDPLIRREGTGQDEKTKLVEIITAYLFSHYQEPITIDDVAFSVGLTKSYMSHLFKEVTGYTIMNYLMAYRLSRSRDILISEPDLSIKEVSLQSGFKSDAHFSRFFKENIGVSPTEYRSNQEFIEEEGTRKLWQIRK